MDGKGKSSPQAQDDERTAAPSLSDYVYQELSREIREGYYHPGERIRETVITRQLNVSRTPVREAFRRLQAEGRIELEPQRGAMVAELDRQEVAELYMLRQHLEGMAARFAAQHASDGEIAEMELILAHGRACEADLRELNQINWEFHHAIYHAAHNRFLIKVFSALADSLALLRGVKYIPEGRAEHLFEEHSRIVEAIKSRDPDAADAAAQAHVNQSFRTHLEATFYERSRRNRTDK